MMNKTKNFIQIVIFLTILTNSAFAENSGLPDFTKLVEDNNASIVNISTVRKSANKNVNSHPKMPDDELNDFLKKFFGDRGLENPDKKSPRKSSVTWIRIYLLI